MKIRIVLMTLLISLACGCALSPSPSQFKNADYGPVPDASTARKLITEWMSKNLRDPYSAVYTFSDQFKQTHKGDFIQGATFAWGTCGTVNAKNAFGGFAGERLFFAVIKDGQVLDVTYGSIAASQCRGGSEIWN